MFTVNIPHKGLTFSTRFPWKIGFVAYMPQCPDIIANIKKIAEDPFFDGVEVCALTDDQWSRVATLLEGKFVVRGLQPDIHKWKAEFSLNSFDDDSRKAAIELIEKEIDIASKHGVKIFSLISGPDPGPSMREQAKALLVESLREICSYAKEREAYIIIEPQDRINKNLLIGPLRDAVDVLKEVRRWQDNVGLLWDLSHAPLLNETVNDLEEAGDLLAHIHIGCAKRVNNRLLDTHPVFYTHGAVNGVYEVTRLLAKLLEMGYKGMVSLEVRPEEDQSLDSVIATAKGVLVTAYAKMVIELLRARA